MKIRTYEIGDTQAIMQLFYDTVHEVNIRDYTQEQVDAWAPTNMDADFWTNSLKRKYTYVAEEDTQIIGFGELEDNGHIGCFYCHKDFQGKGVGKRILQQIESKARSLGIQRLFVEASITARPFFEKRGFITVRQQEVERRGQTFINFVMEKTLSLSAIVLAGGQSSRMGRDKALISLQGVPLLRQICDIALSCTSEVYVVTPWPERYQDVLPDACRVIQEVPLPGETTSHGPLVGFAQALAWVETDWVLLLACDLPHLQVKVLQDWALELQKTAPDAMPKAVREATIALLPRHPKGWEPLCGFYRRQCLPILTQYIDEGGRSFQDWLAQHPVQELPVSDTQLLFNCNTPADLEQVNDCN
jgi:molybdopterin-guanine dinucleotide biosynthesis protein A